MTHINLILQGMPYVPGMAQGVLRNESHGVDENTILLVNQKALPDLVVPPAGIIVIDGAPFSHALIKYRSLSVPIVIITANDAGRLREYERLQINGGNGKIANVNLSSEPDSSTIDNRFELVTKDGIKIDLRVSVRDIATIDQAVTVKAQAIGLVRSEFFLPSDGRMPDAAYYQNAFKQVCLAAKGMPVTIRLLDLSADKLPRCLSNLVETDGVLGAQGVRLYSHPTVRQILNAQLSAIADLSKEFDLRVLLPYLVRREELKYWVDNIRSKISNTKIGAMVETPAGALDCHNWFDIADFVALGCNDLMQCVFATDRDNPQLGNYLDPYAPLLYRFLAQIAERCEGNLDKIQVCGVLSQLPGIMPIFLGLGYRNFSVDVALVPFLKQIIAQTSLSDAKLLANKVCLATETQDVKKMLDVDGFQQSNFYSG